MMGMKGAVEVEKVLVKKREEKMKSSSRTAFGTRTCRETKT
jgi:hypothetical protein